MLIFPPDKQPQYPPEKKIDWCVTKKTLHTILFLFLFSIFAKTERIINVNRALLDAILN